MILVENRIEVRAGSAEAILDRFRSPKNVHTFPGFVRMEVLHAVISEEAEVIRVCTTWESEADFHAWTNSDSFRQAHSRRPEQGQSSQESGTQAHGAQAHGEQSQGEQAHGEQAQGAGHGHAQGNGHGSRPAGEAGGSPILGTKVTVYQVAVTHLPESAVPAEQ